jgi:hypothetical protein
MKNQFNTIEEVNKWQEESEKEVLESYSEKHRGVMMHTTIEKLNTIYYKAEYLRNEILGRIVALDIL